ncbi:MAG: hypothetical protein DIU72_006880 [Pseudomonadota bacterium]|nr:MAG: hypothetical protein DIU72_06855 [Pseudomonadota bacterium]
MVLCLVAAYRFLLGADWGFPLRLLAALVLGAEAFERPDLRTLLVGYLVHQLGPVALWARLFGLLLGFRKAPPPMGLSLAVGLAVALVALVLDVYLLLPPVLSMMHGANIWAENVPRAVAWVAHGVYGGVLGVAYGLLARVRTEVPNLD